MEIEKKYLLNEIPFDLSKFDKQNIIQGYISTDPVIRLRAKNEDYILTMKGSGTMSREEYELIITEQQFDKLWLKVDSSKIEKTRYLIPLPTGHTAELDIFHSTLAGLITVEVEFESLDDATTFIAPDWFGEDITHNKKHKNSYLSLYGLQ